MAKADKPRRSPAERGTGAAPKPAAACGRRDGGRDRGTGPTPVPPGLVEGKPERLQKILAHAGVASRRAAEELILAGRVKVNGQVVTVLGTKAVPGRDRIEVDNRPIGLPEDLAYIALNKPKGYVTTLYDPQGRPTILDLIPSVPVRVFPVGRLDYDTTGLLLLTNDGELAHRLMHPAREVWKTYVARVRGVPSQAKLRRLEKGIELEDGPTAPARCRLLGVRRDPANPANQTAWVEISIHEGRYRQVRRMLAAIGHEVISLTRTRIGPLRLVGLAPGQYRYLDLREIHALRQAVGLRPDPPRNLVRPPVRGPIGPEAPVPVPAAPPRQAGKLAAASRGTQAPASPRAPRRWHIRRPSDGGFLARRKEK